MDVALPAGEPPRLDFTGERVLPDVDANLAQHNLLMLHRAIYTRIAADCIGKRVCDIGCGSGHGLALLSTRAAAIYGLDLSPDAVRFAGWRFPRLRGGLLVSDSLRVGLAAHAFDVLSAVEVFEHVPSASTFLAEMLRLLHPAGCCWISTPNRLVHSPGQTVPANPFHTVEYTYDEFLATLQRYFRKVTIFCTVVSRRSFLIRAYNSAGLTPRLPFPVGNIERFLAWRVSPWNRPQLRPDDIRFTHDAPATCWGFLARCADPH